MNEFFGLKKIKLIIKNTEFDELIKKKIAER